MKSILILGATGFIGKPLVSSLKHKYKVYAYGRKKPEDWVDSDNVCFITGEFATEENFDSLLENIDVVYHLICSAVPSDDTSNIEKEIMENVIPTIRLLEAVKEKPGVKLIFASSAGTVYGETDDAVNSVLSPTNPKCSYGVQKIVIEDYIEFYGRRYGLNYIIARMSNPYGIGQDPNKVQGLIPILIRKAMNNESALIYGDGENIRDYIYLPELIEGLKKLISYVGNERMFNLGFGKYYSIIQVISKIESVTGLSFKDKKYTAERFCDVKKSIVDYKSSQRELKWEPVIDLEEGIHLTYETIRAQ